jgi:hypothetical protein
MKFTLFNKLLPLGLCAALFGGASLVARQDVPAARTQTVSETDMGQEQNPGPAGDRVIENGTLVKTKKGDLRYQVLVNESAKLAYIVFYNDTSSKRKIAWKLRASSNVRNTSGTTTVAKRSKEQIFLEPANPGAAMVPGRFTGKAK